LPLARRDRFVEQYGLSRADATLLTAERSVADFFEEVAGEAASVDSAKTAANWIINDLFGLQRERGLPPETLPVTPAQLRELIELVRTEELTLRAARELLPQVQPGESPRAAAERLSLLALRDEEAIRQAVAETLTAFPQAVEDYRRGKTAAIGRLIGETIKRTGGRARPEVVRALLEEALRGPYE
jgi:aspartyl-tRNA(Asn)/glutamyl-tRNA(Gln) amidotransferase subunit B